MAEWEGQTFEGEVKSFSPGAGRGFIACPEVQAAFGGDVYVHGTVMENSGANVGDRVSFKLHLNAQGKPQASAPMTVLEVGVGEAAQQACVGIVKSFNDKNGYGFIDCPEVKEQYGRDVFLPGLKASGFAVGQEVNFTFELNGQGQPAVADIWPMTIHHKGGVMAAKAHAKGMLGMAKGGKMGGKMDMGGKGGKGFKGGKGGGPAGPFYGVVKSFNESNGYGFVACDETFGFFARDVYFSAKDFEQSGVTVGQEVEFAMIVKDGKPVVAEMYPAGPAKGKGSKGKGCFGKDKGGFGKDKGGFGKDKGAAPRPPSAAASTGKGYLVPKVRGLPAPPAAPAASRPPAAAPMEAEDDDDEHGYAGTISSINLSSGQGVIDCETVRTTFGTDVAVDVGLLGAIGARIGDSVKFDFEVNDEGAPQALPGLKLARRGQAPARIAQGSPRAAAQAQGPPGQGPPRQAPQGEFRGKVKSMNKLNGYGFIECAQTMATYRRDVFLPLDKAKGSEPGQSVTFTISLNKDGMPVCAELWPATSAGQKRKVDDAALEDGAADGMDSDQLADEVFEEDAAMEEAPEEAEAEGEAYEGVVKSFDLAYSRGWIDCDVTQDLYGSDVYVHRNVLAQSGANVGDTVSFKIHLNKEGKPQASFPLKILAKGVIAEYEGVVKSFNDLTGYGFVACQATFDVHGRDVYLPAAKGSGYQQGQKVYFNIDLQPDGKPVVSEIWPKVITMVDSGGKGKGGLKGGPKGGLKGCGGCSKGFAKGCQGGCQGGCKGGCLGGCKGGCSGGCKGGCPGGCKGGPRPPIGAGAAIGGGKGGGFGGPPVGALAAKGGGGGKACGKGFPGGAAKGGVPRAFKAMRTM